MRWFVFLAVLASGGSVLGQECGIFVCGTLHVNVRDGETLVLGNGFYERAYVHSGGTLVLEDGAFMDERIVVHGGGTFVNTGGAGRSLLVEDGGKASVYSRIEAIRVYGPNADVVIYAIPEYLRVDDGATVDVFIDADPVIWHPIDGPPYWEPAEWTLPATYTTAESFLYDKDGGQRFSLGPGPGGGTVNLYPYAVPEPSSATLFLLGLLGLRRRRR